MKTTPLSDVELAALAREVDDQIATLQTRSADFVTTKSFPAGERAELPGAPDQQALIERVTGEPFETFWQKYKRHARRDLCLPGGLLRTQWEKWRDLQSKDAVKMSLGALVAMGISTANVPALAVAATVFLLNVVAKIGIEAVCEGCAEEEAAREQARKDETNAKPPQP